MNLGLQKEVQVISVPRLWEESKYQDLKGTDTKETPKVDSRELVLEATLWSR